MATEVSKIVLAANQLIAQLQAEPGIPPGGFAGDSDDLAAINAQAAIVSLAPITGVGTPTVSTAVKTS